MDYVKRKYDPERIDAGCCENDRQRRIIARTLGNIIAAIKGFKNWEGLGEICNVQLPEKASTFRLIAGEWLGFSKEHDILVYLGPEVLRGRAASIPHEMVPAVYAHLSDIIEAADAAVPSARINQRFRFFESQAPLH